MTDIKLTAGHKTVDANPDGRVAPFIPRGRDTARRLLFYKSIDTER